MFSTTSSDAARSDRTLARQRRQGCETALARANRDRPSRRRRTRRSDREHIEALVRAQGFKMPAGMMYLRLVHLLDAERRRELMIIYGEDLAGTGHTAAELDAGGKAHGQWAAIEKNLIERATRAIALRTTSRR